MTVPPKTRLGPYEIEDLLGTGGMGEVYRAHDLRLQRIVALKIVTEVFSEEPSLRERFRREARAASKLSHPNICTIYDFGEWEGRQFLVMEYVAGQPLSNVISWGPLPIDQLLNLFIQLAGALESAHLQGIIHRDVKPANLLVTTLGQLKVVDFGLAKLAQSASAIAVGPDGETAQWIHGSLTSTATTIGTVSYMSPEQARGEELDARSDLFSLGLVLYEAATGRRAFSGNTAAVVFASLLKEEPIPATQLNPSLPLELGDIISKAIEKDRDLRYQHASDVLADLRRLKRSIETGTLGRAAVPAARWRPSQKMLVLGVSIIGLVVLALTLFSVRPRTRRITLSKPQRLTAASIENPVFQSRLSPDGKMIAYGDEFGVHLQLLSTHESWTLLRAEPSANADIWWPADWFPDGNQLLVNSGKTTPTGVKFASWVVSVHSGRAVKLREDCIAQSISPDGLLIAFTAGGVSAREEIWIMGSNGEAAKKIVSSQNVGNTDSVFSSLRWSPDGRRVAFRKDDHNSDRTSVENVSLNAGRSTVIDSNAEHWGDFCWLRDGRLVFPSGSRNGSEDMNLWELRIAPESGAPIGQMQQLTDWTGFSVENLSVSKDGARLSFDKISSQTDVFVSELNTKGSLEPPRRLTLDDYDDVPSAWANDNATVFFTTVHQGSFLIQKQSVNATQPEPVLTSQSEMNPVRLTPDGSSLIYIGGVSAARRLMLAPASGGIPEEFDFGNRGVVVNVVCSQQPARNCLAGTLDRSRHQLVLWQIEPPNRDIHRLFVIDYDLRKGLSWTLSPDGTNVAVNGNYLDHAEIEVYSLQGVLKRRVRVNGFNQLFSIDWAADGSSWFVGTSTATGCSLLRVYQDGRGQVLLNMRGRDVRTFAIPSRNGRRLAVLGWTISRNVWMVDEANRLQGGG